MFKIADDNVKICSKPIQMVNYLIKAQVENSLISSEDDNFFKKDRVDKPLDRNYMFLSAVFVVVTSCEWAIYDRCINGTSL